MTPTDPTTTHSTDSSNFYNVTAGGDHMPRRAGLPVEHAARAGEPLAPERAGPGVAGRAGQGVRDGAGLPPPPPPFDARIFAARASRRDDEPRPVKLKPAWNRSARSVCSVRRPSAPVHPRSDGPSHQTRIKRRRRKNYP